MKKYYCILSFFCSWLIFAQDFNIEELKITAYMDTMTLSASPSGKYILIGSLFYGEFAPSIRDLEKDKLYTINEIRAERLYGVSFFEDHDMVIISCGRTWIDDQRDLYSLKLSTGEINWNYHLQDFFTEKTVDGKKFFVTGLYNSGIIAVFDLDGKVILQKKAYNSSLFFAGMDINNKIICKGAEDFKNGIFSIKVYDLAGNQINTISDVYQEDQISICKNTPLVGIYNKNTYYKKSEYTRIYNYVDGKKVCQFISQCIIEDLVFSEKGDKIYTIGKYNGEYYVEVFNNLGTKLGEKKVDNPDSRTIQKMEIDSNNNITLYFWRKIK